MRDDDLSGEGGDQGGITCTRREKHETEMRQERSRKINANVPTGKDLQVIDRGGAHGFSLSIDRKHKHNINMCVG